MKNVALCILSGIAAGVITFIVDDMTLSRKVFIAVKEYSPVEAKIAECKYKGIKDRSVALGALFGYNLNFYTFKCKTRRDAMRISKEIQFLRDPDIYAVKQASNDDTISDFIEECMKGVN